MITGLKNALIVTVVAYFLAAIYFGFRFEKEYARDSTLAEWVLVGPTVVAFKSWLWPLYVFGSQSEDVLTIDAPAPVSDLLGYFSVTVPTGWRVSRYTQDSHSEMILLAPDKSIIMRLASRPLFASERAVSRDELLAAMLQSWLTHLGDVGTDVLHSGRSTVSLADDLPTIAIKSFKPKEQKIFSSLAAVDSRRNYSLVTAIRSHDGWDAPPAYALATAHEVTRSFTVH